MPLTTKLPRAADTFAALPQSDYNEGRALAAATAERVVIPDGAEFVLFSCTDSFSALMGDGTVTAAMPVDTTNGSASLLNPSFRKIPSGATHISVISTRASQMVMEFFAGS